MGASQVRLILAFICIGSVLPAAKADDTTTPAARIVVGAAGFSLRLPKVEAVVYRGAVSHDGLALNSGHLLYPAPGIAGLLVAIATHGVIVEAAKNSEKTRLQQTADQVLAPYKDAIGGFSNRELMNRGMSKLTAWGNKRVLEAADHAESGWIIDSAPVFTMTQDRSALILDNAISIHASDAPASAVYQNVVRVVSRVQEGDNLELAWGTEQGKRLKDESVDLFAHSLNLVLHEIAKEPKDAAPTQKTFRYPEGKALKIERGELVNELCDRVILKTLRGWLLSVPARKPSGEPSAVPCEDPYRYPA